MTRKELLEKRGDLSQFLIHLTRSGDLKLDKDIYSLPKDQFVQITAKKSLELILRAKRLDTKSAFGYFNYKVPLKRGSSTLNQHSQVKRDWLRAVCFTETPLDHIHLQTANIYGRQLHFEPYGLAFKEEVVRGRNGNPVFYLETNNRNVRAAFDAVVTSPMAQQFKQMMPLVEGFGAPWYQSFGGPTEIDFRWEREWRVCGDFSFATSDIAFGICPAGEIPYFENLMSNQVPFVDPVSNLAVAKQKLKGLAHLADLK